MVTAFFVGTTIAQAVSVEWGGQLRPRFEYNEQAGFNASQKVSTPDNNEGGRNGDYFVSTRIRLNAKVDILPDTSAFIQLQSVRNWGNDVEILPGNVAQPLGAGPGGGGSSGGSGNAAFSPSDNDNSVGIHQAYFTLKNFATLPVDLKLGRQQVVIDGHRIFGHTGWTQGAQTHDAVRLTHHEGNHTLSYVYSLGNEGARRNGILKIPGTGADNDDQDIEIHLIYANMKGILGGGLSLYFVAIDDDCSTGGGIALAGPGTAITSGCRNGITPGSVSTAAALQLANIGAVVDNNIYTVGARQAGQLYGIDYRVEYYYQFGEAEGDALNTGVGAFAGGAAYSTLALPGSGNQIKDADRSAYMFGARIGKKFNNVMWKPSITFWYDYLSGTSDEDARDGDYETFNTLFDTGHKFYGYMDLFLPATGANTRRLGLVDYAIKTSLQPAKGWKFKAAWHYFTTAESITVNTNLSGANLPGATSTSDGNDLGNELDLTIVHKYNANTTISAGWSHFWQEQGFEVVNGAASSTGNPSTADWAYLMFDVKF